MKDLRTSEPGLILLICLLGCGMEEMSRADGLFCLLWTRDLTGFVRVLRMN